MASNGCCGGTTQPQGQGADYCNGVNVKLTRVQIDQKNLKGLDPCVTVFGVKAEITEGPLNQCTETCSWCKWFWMALAAILVLVLLVFALKGMMGGSGWASATSSTPAYVAQAGQNPVSATANPVNYTEVNLNGMQLASTGVKPNVKPTKPAVPANPVKCVVFDPNGAMRTFGTQLTVDGTNYVITATADGELASPNDIQAAQAARKNWVTVVLDPQGPYAVTSNGTSIPVKMDNSGRILVSATQVSI